MRKISIPIRTRSKKKKDKVSKIVAKPGEEIDENYLI